MTERKKEAAIAALTEFSEDIPPPVLRRFIVNDATVEKLGELLNENPNGLMLERDELGGWLSLMQTEDGALARAFYLECFDGTNSYTYDRIGRGTIVIESCCLSLIGCIQPSRIAPLVRGAVSGEMDDGLVQRLQLAVWPDDERDWKFVDRKPDEEAQERVKKLSTSFTSCLKIRGAHFVLMKKLSNISTLGIPNTCNRFVLARFIPL